MYTTLNRIRANHPCQDGWEKLLNFLGKTKADDEPLSFETILKSNGLDDALWCCCTAPEYAKEWRLFAVGAARQVQYLMDDQRSLDALDVAERYANGEATDEELKAAWRDARDAAWGVTEVTNGMAAWAAAWTVTHKVDVSLGVAQAEREATQAAARAATQAATWEATREAIREEFRRLVS